MAIQDSDAERRNLMLASIGFVLYYSAGGHFVNNQVKIQVVNLAFDKPELLGVFAWLMLFWFLLRYWQTHKTKASSAISSDIGQILFTNLRKLIILYVNKKTKLAYEVSNGYLLGRMEIKLLKWTIHYSLVDKFEKNIEDNTSSYHVIKEEQLRLSWLFGTFIMMLAFFVACFKNTGFTSYVVPYILFITAVSIPAIQYVYAC